MPNTTKFVEEKKMKTKLTTNDNVKIQEGMKLYRLIRCFSGKQIAYGYVCKSNLKDSDRLFSLKWDDESVSNVYNGEWSYYYFSREGCQKELELYLKWREK